MRIGNILLPSGAGLAPMAGVTDAAMRLLCHETGAAWAVSEMLSAKGWIYSGGKNQATRELLTRLPGEGIAGLQLFGREPEILARAAAELESAGFEFIDLNFGCPAPKITGNGEGSALMREPELIGRIVSAVANATHLPVTAKIRAGWDETCVNAPEVARICESWRAGNRRSRAHADAAVFGLCGLVDHRKGEKERFRSGARQWRRSLGRGRSEYDRANWLRRRDRRARGAGQSMDFCRNPRVFKR